MRETEQQGQSNNIVELAFILTSSIHAVACVTIRDEAIFIDANTSLNMIVNFSIQTVIRISTRIMKIKIHI